MNLYQPLAERSLLAFSRGSGSELSDTAKRPATMRALRSSAAPEDVRNLYERPDGAIDLTETQQAEVQLVISEP